MPKNISYLFVLLAALLWGSSAAVGKLLLTTMNNLQFQFYTAAFALLGVLPVLFSKEKRKLIRKYRKQDYLNFAVMGIVGFFIYPCLFYAGIMRLPTQEAFLINYMWPVMVILFAVLLTGLKMTPRKWTGIACSFVGVAIVISKGDLANFHFGSVPGVLFSASGAVVYGYFSVVARRHNYEKYTCLLFYSIFSLIAALIAVLIFSSIPWVSPWALVGLAWQGLFTRALAYLFWFLALKWGDVTRVSNMIFMTPFFSLVYIHFLVGEKILISSIIGLLVILLGVLMPAIQFKKQKA